jgi:hypothetical protein
MTLKRKRVLCREKRTLTARTEKGEAMSRLIDAEIAYDKIAEQETSYYMDMEGVQAGLDETPTVDAVQVVRCKDCEYYVETNGRIGTCELTISGAEDDGFCAWGVRKDDE